MMLWKSERGKSQPNRMQSLSSKEVGFKGRGRQSHIILLTLSLSLSLSLFLPLSLIHRESNTQSPPQSTRFQLMPVHAITPVHVSSSESLHALGQLDGEIRLGWQEYTR